MISTFWKQEFRLEQLWMEHSRPSEFTRCQWQRSGGVSTPYLIYRWLLAGYFFCSLIACITEPSAVVGFTAKWPIYLTNWGYLIYTAQTALGAFIVTSKARRERAKDFDVEQKELKMPRLYKAYWVLQTMSVVLAFGITISYWAAVYNPKEHTLSPFNLMVHAINSILIGLDFFLVGHPFRLFHFVWPVLFVAVYLVFSAVYYSLGGTDRHNRPHIYPLLSWEHGGRTVLVGIVGLAFVFGVHCAAWTLFLLRRGVATACGRGRTEAEHAKKGFENSVTCSNSSMQLEVV